MNNYNKKLKPNNKSKWTNYISFFIPKGDHFVTSIIIDLNIILFIVVTVGGVDMFKPSAAKLHEFGALKRTTVLNGDWWRLLTNTFLHAGLYHIAYNVFGIILGGIALEPLLGRKRFTMLYILSALGGSIASIMFTKYISVGASGAILGCFGAMIILAFTPLYKTAGRKTMLMIYGGYAALTIIIGFITPNVDNAAHIGGLLTGAFVAFIMYRLKNMQHTS